MEQVIGSRSLRQRSSECVARASQGETFIVCYYGRPAVALGPRSGEDPREEVSATTLWRDMPRALGWARRSPVLITWRGQPVAVLGPVPEEWRTVQR